MNESFIDERGLAPLSGVETPVDASALDMDLEPVDGFGALGEQESASQEAVLPSAIEQKLMAAQVMHDVLVGQMPIEMAVETAFTSFGFEDVFLKHSAVSADALGPVAGGQPEVHIADALWASEAQKSQSEAPLKSAEGISVSDGALNELTGANSPGIDASGIEIAGLGDEPTQSALELLQERQDPFGAGEDLFDEAFEVQGSRKKAPSDVPVKEGVQLAETVFIGGAGDNGPYREDFVRAFREAGIENVRVSKEPISIAPNKEYGMILDAVGVLLMNDAGAKGQGPYLNMKNLAKQSKDPKEQYNLVGYSWGSVMAAQQALSETEVHNKTVDHLVLIGSPLNQSMVDRLKKNSKIKKLIFVNLDKQGDPIVPGMSDFELTKSVPLLIKQMVTGNGHFYYNSMSAEGQRRRDALGKELKQKGLK